MAATAPTTSDSPESLSYTAQRLQHATPAHLYYTTRRCFIGPIPEGWLKNHRRDWYKHHLHIHYSSRSATFSADSSVGRHRRLTGLDGPSAAATYRQSFPPPSGLDDEGAEEQDDEDGQTDEQDDDGTVLTEAEPDAIITPAATRDVVSSSDSPETQPLFSSTRSKRRKEKRPKSRKSVAASSASFITAQESPALESPTMARIEEHDLKGGDSRSTQGEQPGPSEPGTSISGNRSPLLGEHASNVSLLRQDREQANSARNGLSQRIASDGAEDDEGVAPKQQPDVSRIPPTGLVRFDLPDDAQKDRHVKQKLAQMSKRKSFKNLSKKALHDGSIVKMENMLVRVEFTIHDMPADFDENDSGKIESRTMEKWREYMVVCRESSAENVPFVLQLYKTRVIPAVERTHVRKTSAHLINLRSSECKINLYSSLDKTMVIWVPSPKGHLVYIMQAKSGASSMEWYTFLRNVLGQDRESLLQVNVPDLEVHLRLENPFATIESAQDIEEAAAGNEEAVLRTMNKERAVAATIVNRCMEMLEGCNEWQAVVKNWERHERMGLAWKRYDRLEWVNGANEKKMYGTIGMERTHELELRPKQHYPTTTRRTIDDTLTEPAPIEGFLVRLTSQRGEDRKFRKLFFKRLYFSTHNQYLAFNRPGKADPPPPPDMPIAEGLAIPSAEQIVHKTPIIYSVNPFPIDSEGYLQWMSHDCSFTKEVADHDLRAYQENERKLRLLLDCDGVVNLCNIVKIRNVKRGAIPADENLEEGEAVDFDLQLDDTDVEDDGTTDRFDDARTFELVLRNGLVIRLQAYNRSTKHEWQNRLRALVEYWKLRVKTDLALYKTVREQNLSRLNIDEETEAFMGQFAHKWEVSNSFASPELYNMCGISCCRSIHISGTLYRRPRMHGAFQRNLVILSHGQLLIFQDALRSRTGGLLKHIHHNRVASLDLQDCYIYSGLITEHDLLYTSSSFDVAHPGRHALPRIYAEDGWSSSDENTMTCFVVWHGKRSSWFKSQDREREHGGKKRNKLKKVTRLGAEGKSVLFKCRSRAERDRWVMAIGMEIERLAEAGDDARIVGEEQQQ